MRSLDRTTDAAMRDIERTIKSSASRQESAFASIGDRIGKKFGSAFKRGIGAFLGLNFIKNALEEQAKEGNTQAQHQLDNYNNFWNFMYKTAVEGSQKVAGAVREGLRLGPAVGMEMIGNRSGIAKQITDRIIVPPEDVNAASSSLENYLNIFTDTVETYVSKTSELQKAGPGVFAKIKEDLSTATDVKTGSLGQQQLQFIVNLQDELKLLGMTNDEQEVYNNLKSAAALTDKVAAGYIADTTHKIQEQRRELAALKDANDALEESSKTFVQGLLDGQSAVESLNNALRQLASTLLDMAFKSLFNPGGTPLLQSLFSGSLGIGGSTGGAGNIAQVGNSALTAGRSGGSGMAPQFHTNINVNGSVDQKTLGAMKGMIERNNVRQNQELQRNWGNMSSRYSALRGP
jgi:hypothetical protein